jgi:hypothetical protein
MREISLPFVNQDSIKEVNEKFNDKSYEERATAYANSLKHLNKSREEVVRETYE